MMSGKLCINFRCFYGGDQARDAMHCARATRPHANTNVSCEGIIAIKATPPLKPGNTTVDTLLRCVG